MKCHRLIFMQSHPNIDNKTSHYKVTQMLNGLITIYSWIDLHAYRFISVYDLLTGKVVSRLKGHNQCTRDVSWHPYKNIIMTSSVSRK